MLTPAKTYPPVGECIYCGSRASLGKEHIIPFSLGGALILPKASCRACERVTGAFEGSVGRSMLGNFRIKLELPTRRPKERPTKLGLRVHTNGSHRTEEVSVGEYPAAIMLPELQLPNAVTGRTTMDVRFLLYDLEKEQSQNLAKRMGGPVEIAPAYQVRPFYRMLAKIGHSFAKAELLGADATERFGLKGKSLTFVLPEMILNENANRFRYVGCKPPHPNSKPIDRNTLHRIEIGRFGTGKGTAVTSQWLAVSLRLFEFIGPPEYLILIAQITEGDVENKRGQSGFIL